MDSNQRHRHSGLRRAALLAAAALAALLALATAPTAHAIPEGMPTGYVSEDMARNLGLTTDFLFLPDERCLVLLKSGRILMLKGKKVTGIVADLSDRLGSHVGDRGLVAIEHHPNFPEVPYLYVGYVYDGTREEINEIFAPLAADSPNSQPYYAVGPKLDRLSRFTMTGDVIDPASEVILIGNCTKRQGIWWGDDCAPMVGITHSIDWIKFGPDGALWVSVGDGASFEGTDWTPNIGNNWLGPMDPDFLPGKILRLDENGNGLADNPFYTGDPTAARSRVWATGIRQPWRCDFVPNSNPPELLCGIVGWYTWETVTFIQKGANLGWPCWEGPEKPPYFVINGTGNWDDAICQSFYRGATTYPQIQGSVAPFNGSYHVYGWNHNGQSSAVIAGVFAPKSMEGEFKDCFFVGDFVSSRIDCIPWDFATSRPVGFNVNPNEDELGWRNVRVKSLGTKFDQPVTFKVGPDGNFWALGHCVQCSGYGILRRIIAPGGNTTVPFGNATVGPVTGGDSGGLVIVTGDQCYPKDEPRITVADLPNGWDSIMYVSQFPNVRYPRNGNHGPMEVDASVGGSSPLDGTLMSVGGVTYRHGLGTYATSEVHLPILGYCYRFTSEVGIDDEVLKGAPAGTLTFADKGFGEFILKGDGQVIHNHSDFTGAYAKTGVMATQMEVENLHRYSDLGLYAWKPWANQMPMADTTANHLDWAEARIYCGPDSPYIPKVDISYPEPKNTFNLGDDIIFSGTITAFDGSALTPQSYQWYVNLVHCQGSLCHQHFLENYSGIKDGVFTVQPHPLDNDQQYIYYQLKLVGTDICGRTAYQVRNIVISANSSASTTGPNRSSKREALRRQVDLPAAAEDSYQTLMKYRRYGAESGAEDALRFRTK